MRSNRHLPVTMRALCALADAIAGMQRLPRVVGSCFVEVLPSLLGLRTILGSRALGHFGGRQLAYSRQTARHTNSCAPRSEREGGLAS